MTAYRIIHTPINSSLRRSVSVRPRMGRFLVQDQIRKYIFGTGAANLSKPVCRLLIANAVHIRFRILHTI
jgi:hypothetical protein